MKKYYSYMAGSGQFGICVKCNKGPTEEGHDGCLGTLPGIIMNACCGHGNDIQAYIQYWDGKRTAGTQAIMEQDRLIRVRTLEEKAVHKGYRIIYVEKT